MQEPISDGVQSYLGQGAVIPEVSLVREAVADVAELALLDVLLDGVERLLLGDLHGASVSVDGGVAG